MLRIVSLLYWICGYLVESASSRPSVLRLRRAMYSQNSRYNRNTFRNGRQHGSTPLENVSSEKDQEATRIPLIPLALQLSRHHLLFD